MIDSYKVLRKNYIIAWTKILVCENSIYQRLDSIIDDWSEKTSKSLI